MSSTNSTDRGGYGGISIPKITDLAIPTEAKQAILKMARELTSRVGADMAIIRAIERYSYMIKNAHLRAFGSNHGAVDIAPSFSPEGVGTSFFF